MIDPAHPPEYMPTYWITMKPLTDLLCRVLPVLKEAESQGLKLTTIINTHQYVALYSVPASSDCSIAMVIMLVGMKKLQVKSILSDLN